MPDQTAYQQSTTSNQKAADNDVARTPLWASWHIEETKMQKDRRSGCHPARRASLVSHQLRTPKGSGKRTQGWGAGAACKAVISHSYSNTPLVTRNGRFEFAA